MTMSNKSETFQIQENRRFENILVFLFYFCFAISAAILFQKLALPFLMGSTQGLIQGDSVYFNQVALELADKIKIHGWSEWTIFPAVGASGNVSILGALYVFFTPDISLVLPINASLHALSGLLIFVIGKTLWGGNKGRAIGIIAATLFVVFPSSLNWYAQIHKDGYVIAATLLILFAFVLSDVNRVNVNIFQVICLTTFGSFLLIITKPYHLRIVLAVFTLIVIFSFFFSVYKRGFNASTLLRFKGQLLIIILLGFSFVLAPKGGGQENTYNNWKTGVFLPKTELLEKAGCTLEKKCSDEEKNSILQKIRVPEIPAYIKQWQWDDTSWMPDVIEGQFKNMAQIRVGLIEYGLYVSAGSLIDKEIVPNNVVSFIGYLPRALQVGIFAPFPSDWKAPFSAAKLVSILETLILYIVFLGALFGLKIEDIKKLSSIILFATVMLLIYSSTLANLGTLYRLRYLPEMLFAFVGVAGWVSFYELKKINFEKPNNSDYKIDKTFLDKNKDQSSLKKKNSMLRSSVGLVLITIITYCALLVRDILVAREFGIGHELDAYTVAALIPMFLVAVISAPMGNAFISYFVAVEHNSSSLKATEFARQITFIYIILASALMTVYLLFGNYVLSHFFMVPDKIILDSKIMMTLMMFLFYFSGLVILGNSLFNAKEKYLIPAYGQLFVPIFAILGLLIYGKDFGVKTVVIGMLIGQIANYLFIGYQLNKHQINLLPIWNVDWSVIRQFIGEYIPLILIAIFYNVIMFQSMSVAASMPEGSMAALSLSNKVIVLLVGLLEIVLASIVLPYFSRMLSSGNVELAQKKLSSLLLIGTVISIPFCYLIGIFSNFIVSFLFSGGVFSHENATFVSEILRLSLLQIPFLVVNTLLLKFAIANKQSKEMMLATIGVILFNMFLTKYMASIFGVQGIAVAMGVSALLSSSTLLLVFLKLKQVAFLDLIFISLNWMLFICLMVCLNYSTKSGSFSAILAFVLLLYAEWKVILFGRTRLG